VVSIKEIAKEISILVPKLIRSLQNEFVSIKDITSSQIVILMFLYEGGKTSVGKLAEHMNVSSPTITGLTDRLAEHNYIERKRDVEDRRKVVVTLTKKGKDAVKLFQSGVRKRWEEILKHLTPDERKAYLKIIKKIISIIS